MDIIKKRVSFRPIGSNCLCFCCCFIAVIDIVVAVAVAVAVEPILNESIVIHDKLSIFFSRAISHVSPFH